MTKTILGLGIITVPKFVYAMNARELKFIFTSMLVARLNYACYACFLCVASGQIVGLFRTSPSGAQFNPVFRLRLRKVSRVSCVSSNP